MKVFFHLLLCLITHSGICQDAADEKCPVKKEEFLFNDGWLLRDTVTIYGKDTSAYRLYKKGNGTIFTYRKFFDCHQVFDEEYADVLLWYIPDSLTSFEINLETDSLNVWFQFSFVLNRYHLVGAQGILKGVKINDEWSVSGNGKFITMLKSSGTTHLRMLQFSGNFKKAGYKGKNKKKQQYALSDPFFID